MTQTCLNKKTAVEFYLDRNFVLFPLIGKVPPKNLHWRQVTFNPFFEPKANFGVQLSATDLVIDIDTRNGGFASFEALLGECLELMDLETFTVTTGTGGKHIYLKKPADLKLRKNHPAFTGIDFISEGGYVVGCGSLHPDTMELYTGNSHNIADAPDSLLNLLLKRELATLTEGVHDYAKDEQTKQRYIDYLGSAPVAIEGSNGDATTYIVAATGRDFGLPPDTTYELLLRFYNDRCQPPWNVEQLAKKVYNAYQYAEGAVGSKTPALAFKKEEYTIWTPEQFVLFHKNHNDKLVLDQYNTALMFAPGFPLDGLVALDKFSHQITFRKKAPWHTDFDKTTKYWNDDEASRCRHWLSTNKKYEPTPLMMHDGALAAAYQYVYHPVIEYFESLTWDGHKRVHNWMHNYLGAADDAYTRAVGLKTLVACVKRVYEPGCKFDYIPVLEGDQGTGKSSVWEILASKPWFGDTPIDIGKEWSIMKTFGKLMYEWSEMETFRKANTQAMKGFLSSSADTVRLPYNRMSKDIPRSGIFVGTFNPEHDKDIGWLHDTTGNRRYWVVETGRIQFDKLKQARQQLWAEAVVLYRMGVPIYFEDAAVIEQAQVEQAKRLGKDSWFDAIDRWLNAPHNLDKMVFTGDEIFRDCIGGNLTQYKRPEQTRISNIMLMLRWDKSTHYHKELKAPVSGYRRPNLALE